MIATINETFVIGLSLDKDVFSEIYSNPFINLTMIFFYLLGLVACVGLRMVIWFERSGQAGPYRTLVNQLVTHRIEQTI